MRDPECPAPQLFQFKPVVWINGKAHELPTATGDLNGYAIQINENGQIVGFSGKCAAFNPLALVPLEARHALLWDLGAVTDLGNLGGTGSFAGNFAANLNNNGQVVGASDLPGDTANHGFLWTKQTGMKDLGTLDGDTGSVGLAINDSAVVTGGSFTQDNLRAFIWQNGVMTDLNSLIPADSPLYLLIACSINARGEIIGFAADYKGDTHGYLLSPNNGREINAGVALGARPPHVSEENRKQLLGRFGNTRLAQRQ
jgi:probable HAF family extracellular repeat protein